VKNSFGRGVSACTKEMTLLLIGPSGNIYIISHFVRPLLDVYGHADEGTKSHSVGCTKHQLGRDVGGDGDGLSNFLRERERALKRPKQNLKQQKLSMIF